MQDNLAWSQGVYRRVLSVSVWYAPHLLKLEGIVIAYHTFELVRPSEALSVLIYIKLISP